jgi:hypothetical protein
MITINNINGSPESIPEKYKQQHFDGDFFYFFETEEEVLLFQSFVKPKIENGVIIETATSEDIEALDPRNAPDYYLIRVDVGSELVRRVSDNFLKEIRSGVRTFQEVMTLEEKLEKTMNSLSLGQLLTARYKISLVKDSIPADLFMYIFSEISNLCDIHYQ